MTHTKQIDKGYIVPDPPSPYDLICIKVFVPKHRFYIGAFWGAYQFFTNWLAWVRDPLHKGKQAAALWRTAYDKARELYELNGGSCDMSVTAIRQNPNDKCVLQAQFDGGPNWIDVANFKDCSGCGGGAGGALQFDGINVTQYNDCTGQFEPIGEPYNPTVQHIYDSLYAADESGACNGAANIAAWSNYVSDESLSILSTAGIAGAAVSFIIGTLAQSVGAGFLTESLIASILAELVDSGTLLGDAAALDITEELRDILYPYMDDDGTIREPNFTSAIAALYERRDAETPDTAERVRWGHEVNILSALGPSVVSRQNKYAGITDADCTGAGWVETFDFKASKYGWTKDPLYDLFPSGATGLWVSGEGWKFQTAEHASGGWWSQARIGVHFPARTITRVRIYYDAKLSSTPPDSPFEADLKAGWMRGAHPADSVVDDELIVDGENVFNWTGSESALAGITASLIIWHSSDVSPDATMKATITKITLEGTGTNPFN